MSRFIDTRQVAAAVFALALIATACGNDTNTATTTGPATDPVNEDVAGEAPEGCFAPTDAAAVERTGADLSGTEITLITHDSFATSPEVLEAFTDQTGISVRPIKAGDAGQLVASAVLTAGNPTADVMFGVDNTFMCRALNADVFLPYPPSLTTLVKNLTTDPNHRLTPIDYGDVCVNYNIEALPGDVPQTLDDLTDPTNLDQFVTPNPETSSPGFAFLLATIAKYGEDGWEQYWRDLVTNGVEVTAGWNDAYYGSFTSGGGARSIVTSYASSPPAEVIFADPPIDVPPTAVLTDSCFRQVEYAGILRGTEHPEAAAALIDFMLSETFQNDIPLNMFVYPVNTAASLPDAFVDFTAEVANPLTVDPETIEANRNEWTERWNDIAFG